MSIEIFHLFPARVLIIYPCIAEKICLILPLHFKNKIFFHLLCKLITYSIFNGYLHFSYKCSQNFFLNVQELNQVESLACQ